MKSAKKEDFPSVPMTPNFVVELVPMGHKGGAPVGYPETRKGIGKLKEESRNHGGDPETSREGSRNKNRRIQIRESGSRNQKGYPEIKRRIQKSQGSLKFENYQEFIEIRFAIRKSR